MYTNWTKELLEPIVLSSKSYSECLRKMGRIQAGGNFKNLQRNIDKYGISCEHMTHQAHNQGKELKPFEKLTTNHRIKQRLIKLRGHCCEMCGTKDWLNSPVTLELDHIDGDNRNNLKENVRLLCPNCHSTTDNWRGRNKS